MDPHRPLDRLHRWLTFEPLLHRGFSQAGVERGLLGILTAVFCAPLLVRPLATGAFDWDQHVFYHVSPLKTLVEYGQLPLWNPWYCGGSASWANPQVPLLTPFHLFALVVPVALAMKLNIAAHIALSTAGMHLLTTRVFPVEHFWLRVLLIGACAFGGALPLHLVQGHSTFLPFCYLPLCFYFFARSVLHNRPCSLFAAGGMHALMVYNGGFIPYLQTALGIALFSVAHVVLTRSPRALLHAGVVGIFSPLYSAPRLLPVLLFARSPLVVDTRAGALEPETYLFKVLPGVYTARGTTVYSKLSHEQAFMWQEYGNYVGVAVLLWIAVGVLTPWKHRRNAVAMSLGFASLALFLISLGEFHALAPASFIRSIPGLGAMRVPSRFTLGFAFFITILAALHANGLFERFARSRRTQVSILLAACLGTFDLVIENGRQFSLMFKGPPVEADLTWFKRGQALQHDAVTKGNTDNLPMLRGMLAHRPVIDCYEPLRSMHTVKPERDLVFTEDGSARIENLEFTPSRVRFDITLTQAAEVFLNQNAAEGWTASVDGAPLEVSARNSVRLPTGSHRNVKFRYWPPGLNAGFVLCFLAIALTTAARRFLRRAASNGKDGPPAM